MCSPCSVVRAQLPWTPWQSADPTAANTNRRSVAGRFTAPYLLLVNEPLISLTESAAKRVAWIAQRQQKPAILRLSVDGGGCAGFTYKFELTEKPDSSDEIAVTQGVKLVVDPISLELVKGSSVDFVEDLGGAQFRVTNPNA